MTVAAGTDTPEHRAAPAGAASVLAGVRRLTLLADGATDAETVFRGLADELFAALGVDEVHVHHLAQADAGGDRERVVMYLFGGDARLGYLVARDEQAPGVSWVASTGRSFLAAGPRELLVSVPRLRSAGDVGCALLLPVAVRGEAQAVVVLVDRGSAAVFDEAAIERAATLADQAAAALALVRARAEAGTDPVTGAMNHRAMRRRLEEEIGRVARGGGRLSCMLLDLDDFKQVNDRHGHQAGDTVLREVTRVLMGEFRAFDRVARYGGDEFVVILPNADLDSAAAAGARALERLAGLPAFGPTPGVFASIGVAQWRAPMDEAELLEACDRALLRGKREGKRRVTRAAAEDPFGAS